MNKHLIIIFSALFLFIGAQGCKMSRLLKEQQTEIERLAYGNMSEKEKFIGLAEVLIEATRIALDYDDPDKTLRYLTKFSKKNKKELRLLVEELEPWVNRMSKKDMLSLGQSIITKPYLRKLVTLGPRIVRLAEEGNAELGPLKQVLLLYRLRKIIN